MARVNAAVMSSSSASGVAIFPKSRWYTASGLADIAVRKMPTTRTAVDASRLPS